MKKTLVLILLILLVACQTQEDKCFEKEYTPCVDACDYYKKEGTTTQDGIYYTCLVPCQDAFANCIST